MCVHSSATLPLLCLLLALLANLVDISTAAREDHKQISEDAVGELREYFSSTYLQKVNANVYNQQCFKGGWMVCKPNNLARRSWYKNTLFLQLYHAHHVCTRGGQDGIVVGFEGEQSSSTSSSDQGFLTEDMWNSVSSKAMRNPVEALRIKPQEVEKFSFVRGPTLFQNCYQQKLESANPAHWMMKLGTWFEISSCMIESREKDYGRGIFASPWPMPFMTYYMHQCPDPNLTKWEWGKLMYTIVEKSLITAGVLSNKYRPVHDPGYERIGPTTNHPEMRPYGLTCFDDIYLSHRQGAWINLPESLIDIRKEASRIVGEPSSLLKTPETIADTQPLTSKPAYCGEAKRIGQKTNARIVIFQRTATSNLRKFLNLNEVITLAQSFTTVPVQVLTVNSTTSVKDQIRTFNRFDVLITPHGSHLANGMFTVSPSSKGVIEVVPFAFDRVFYSNFMGHLGFGNYILSTGHLTPKQKNSRAHHCIFNRTKVFQELNCELLEHGYPQKHRQSFIECPTLYHTRMCDTDVNIDLLRSSISDMFFKSLCIDNTISGRWIKSKVENLF